MDFNKLLCAALAVFTALALCFSSGCGRRAPEADEVIIEAGLNTAETPRPTEGASSQAGEGPADTQQPGASPADSVEGALQRVCDLVVSPTLDHMKALYPGEYFTELESELDATLSGAGMTIGDMGYESFDDIIAFALGSLDFARSLNISGLDVIESAEYAILSREPAYTADVVAALREELRYMDPSKITSAYRLNVDFTVKGGGKSKTSNSDVTVYEYDGEFFVLFA